MFRMPQYGFSLYMRMCSLVFPRPSHSALPSHPTVSTRCSCTNGAAGPRTAPCAAAAAAAAAAACSRSCFSRCCCCCAASHFVHGVCASEAAGEGEGLGAAKLPPLLPPPVAAEALAAGAAALLAVPSLSVPVVVAAAERSRGRLSGGFTTMPRSMLVRGNTTSCSRPMTGARVNLLTSMACSSAVESAPAMAMLSFTVRMAMI
mmetsp:Transcript_770/g.1934  ORF Transcript_770/g.1934 Transcript_770/m.1934 type:complete len:204 (-) Transcript_770:2126-2737(-)